MWTKLSGVGNVEFSIKDQLLIRYFSNTWHKKMRTHWCNTSAINGLQKNSPMNQLLHKFCAIFSLHLAYPERQSHWNDDYSKLRIANINRLFYICRTVWNRMLHCQCFSDFILNMPLTFRHHASCILGQAFRYPPENAFYIFNQQIYFIIWYLLDGASLI